MKKTKVKNLDWKKNKKIDETRNYFIEEKNND